MSEIIHISTALPSITPALEGTTAAAVSATRADQVEDTVEISRLGRALARAVGESSYRLARVQAIRAQIADGTYESPMRLSGTVDRLIDILG